MSSSSADQKHQKQQQQQPKQQDDDDVDAAAETAADQTTIATTSNNNNNASALLSVGDVYSVPIQGVDEDELPPPIATATPQHPIRQSQRTLLKSSVSSADSDGKFNSQLSLASMAVSAGGYSTDASTGSSSAAAVAAAAASVVAKNVSSTLQQEPLYMSVSMSSMSSLPPLSTATATTMSKHTRQSSNIPKPPPIKKKQSSAYPPMIAAAEAPPSGEGSDRIRLGICAMDKKARSKPMAEILSRLDEQLFHVVFFGDDVIVNKPVEEWPCVDVLIAFYSKGYPLQKAKEYCALRKPFVLNDLQMQEQLKDRRRVYDLLEASGIDVPRHVFLSKDGYESTGKVVLLVVVVVVF
jgi:inositol hexakisphosphate/diphosphoinositol-pentakisphosphate kinase